MFTTNANNASTSNTYAEHERNVGNALGTQTLSLNMSRSVAIIRENNLQLFAFLYLLSIPVSIFVENSHDL